MKYETPYHELPWTDHPDAHPELTYCPSCGESVDREDLLHRVPREPEVAVTPPQRSAASCTTLRNTMQRHSSSMA